MAQLRLIQEFYSRMSSGDERYEIAHRPLFSLDFSFPNGETFKTKATRDILWKSTELKYLVQDIDMPNLTISASQKEGKGYEEEGFVGAAKGPGGYVVLPEGHNDVEISFLDTQHSVFEYYFLPWLEEVVTVQSNSKFVPFTRANIFIYVFKNDYSEVKYTYNVQGAYPKTIETPKFEYGSSNKTPVRTVTFEYNNIKFIRGSNDSPESNSDFNDVRDQLLNNKLERQKALNDIRGNINSVDDSRVDKLINAKGIIGTTRPIG